MYARTVDHMTCVFDLRIFCAGLGKQPTYRLFVCVLVQRQCAVQSNEMYRTAITAGRYDLRVAPSEEQGSLNNRFGLECCIDLRGRQRAAMHTVVPI